MENVVLAENPDCTILYHEGLNAVAVMKNGKQNTPTSSIEKQSGSDAYMAWGDANNYPQNVLTLCENNSIIPSTINWKVRTVKGNGLVYGTFENGTFTPVELPEVELFLEQNDIDLYLEESLSDLFWWGNAFPELVLDANRNQVIAIAAQEAMHCRYSKQNTKGQKEFVFVDANWPEGKETTWTKIKTIDPYFDPVTWVKSGKDVRFVYPLSISSPGKVYYQRADWHSVVFGGWLDVANKIPEFKKAILDNQVSIKYLIEVADYWWEWKYPNWAQLKPEDKKAKQQEEFKNFTDFMSGAPNAGKALMVQFKTDKVTGKEWTGWKVTPVEDKYKTGMYMEESQEASAHILFALGVDATLIGNTPGKGMGSGSGSDKKVAHNIFVLNHKTIQEKVSKPLNFIAKYNNWMVNGKQVKFINQNYLIATQEQESAIKKSQE